jgi:lipid A 3-O-deacylase
VLGASVLAALVGGLMPHDAHADSASAPSAVFLEAGSGGGTHEQTAGLTWDWDKTWSIGGGRISGYWEASIARWSYTGETGRSTSLGKLEVAPMFRYRASDGASPWFIEGGIGLTLMNRMFASNRNRFSTRYNFGDHLAIGRSFGPQGQYEVALRLEHVSNAGLKEPNPGESLVQLRLSYGFR